MCFPSYISLHFYPLTSLFPLLSVSFHLSPYTFLFLSHFHLHSYTFFFFPISLSSLPTAFLKLISPFYKVTLGQKKPSSAPASICSFSLYSSFLFFFPLHFYPLQFQTCTVLILSPIFQRSSPGAFPVVLKEFPHVHNICQLLTIMLIPNHLSWDFVSDCKGHMMLPYKGGMLLSSR